MISVVSNLSSLNAQRHLSKTQSRLNQNIARLSSGLRINRAADDASGLAISDQLRTQVKGLSQQVGMLTTASVLSRRQKAR